jgi:hypothetical protein
LVLHAVEPFVSAKDIRAGPRWQAEIARELDDTDFGLICVTKENQGAEWLNFEAGALAKSVNSSRVVPVAIDLSPADIANPLGQFQATKLTKEDIGEVLASMNEACPSPIDERNLRKATEKWWPDLQEELEKIESRDYGVDSVPSTPSRTDRELLEEVLDSVRGFGRGPVPLPRAIDNEQERVEQASNEFDHIIMAKDGGISFWGTRKHGNVISVETDPPPKAALYIEADRIGTKYGVEFRLGPKGMLDQPPPVEQPSQ